MGEALLTAGEAPRNNRYEGISRVGIVVDRRTGRSGPQVRVQYPDREVVSAWTGVIQKNTVGTKDYSLPELGERVLVQHLANGPERGVVVGCVYNEAVSAAAQGDLNNRQVEFRDGTVVEYNPGAKAMTIRAAGTITVDADGPITIRTNAEALIESTAPCTIKAPLVTIDAPECVIKGNLTVEGNISIASGLTGDTVAIGGNIVHQGNMETSGEHHDSRGYHTSGAERTE